MANISDPLIGVINGAIQRLLEEADPSIRNSDENPDRPKSGPDEVPLGFVDRLKAIELGVKWVMTKNRLGDGDTDDEFSKLRRGHVNGGTRKRSSSGASSRTNGAGHA